MTVLATQRETLPYLSSEERLRSYQLIVDGCAHIFSKGKLQLPKATQALKTLVPLTKNDPFFLARLTSYSIKKTKNKDLQLFTAYVNALSSADGMPFSPGSKYKKPDLRIVSAAAIQMLDPKMVARVLELAELKFAIDQYLNEARHFPTSLRTALEKYLTYRENNLNIVKGVKEAGLGNTLKKLYRGLHKAPTDEVAKILRWQQKNKKLTFEDSLFDFKDKSDLEIAETIRAKRLPVLGVLGALPRTISPVVAVALLEQATGNQAVILRKTFEDAGILNDPDVMRYYTDKIATAKTALDRAATVSATASDAVQQAMKTARSTSRKAQTETIGKIFLHLDFSGSMGSVLQFAIERGAIIAECVSDPANNFRWGMFSGYGEQLPLPEEFTADAFAAQLFGRTMGGSTNCFALYPAAREFGADIDVFCTDQDHTDGNLLQKIQQYHRTNPDVAKPRCCVIVHFHSSWGSSGAVKQAYEAIGVPVSVLKPEALTESALVVEAVRTALHGPVAIIDDIMATELLKLPEWYYSA